MKIFTKIKTKYIERQKENYQDYIRKLAKNNQYNARDLALKTYAQNKILGYLVIFSTILITVVTVLSILLAVNNG